MKVELTDQQLKLLSFVLHVSINQGYERINRETQNTLPEQRKNKDIDKMFADLKLAESLRRKFIALLTKETVPTHYVLIKPTSVFVKEAQFFKDQGGLSKDWGKNWKPVVAGSIEEARRIGETMRGEKNEKS